MKNTFVKGFIASLLGLLLSTLSWAQSGISGVVIDKKTGEPLISAGVTVQGTTKGTTTNFDGEYSMRLEAGKYKIAIVYISYETQVVELVVEEGKTTILNAELDEAGVLLNDVVIVAKRRTDTEISMLSTVKSNVQVVSGVSSQQIGKSLDKDASEVVKRIAGVTIQDDRFIVVRGLNQRYNNIWMNNAAVPSSETDSRAFSFDVVPSGAIDNLLLFKTAAPELSAEATGGFVRIKTKAMPEESFVSVEYATAYNTVSTFKEAYHLPSSNATDFLAFDVKRALPNDFPANLNDVGGAEASRQALRLGNNWTTERSRALPYQKLGINLARKWTLDNNKIVGTYTSFGYSNNSNALVNAENKQYENAEQILHDYTTNTWSKDFKISLLHNWAWQTKEGTSIEFKNLLNQVGVDKSSELFGWNNYRQSNFKYFSNQYSARTTYSGQLVGEHRLGNANHQKLDWVGGFSYANRLEPNRQNWSMRETQLGSEVYEYSLPLVASINELGRLYLSNHEYTGTAAANYNHSLKETALKTSLKTGVYAELKSRKYAERSIAYRKNASTMLTDAQINALPFDQLFTEEYLGAGKVLLVDDQTNIANSYTALNSLYAAYAAANMEYNGLTAYFGLRVEHNTLQLDGYYDVNTPVEVHKPILTLAPSVNLSYPLNEKNIFRLGYAKTVNRPEFREISPLSYYDFTDRSFIRGNPDLQNADIHNIDFRYEFYPSKAETYSIALFYKHFTNPIEMLSFAPGANYSYANAPSAYCYGVEFDIRQSFDAYLPISGFGALFNASIIGSEVDFSSVSTEQNRRMQGQAPYVVNLGLSYNNDKLGFSANLMYNTAGDKILVAAQLNQGQVITPNIMEQSRHVIDLALSQKLGKYWQLKLGIKDLFAQDYHSYQIYEKVDGGTVKHSNRRYNLGQSVQLGAVVKF
ncbi:MAG: outer membrane beta-barrel protein [Bacteroidales bacterium]